MAERRVIHREVTSRVDYDVDPAARTVEEETVVQDTRSDLVTDEIRARALREVEAADREAARIRGVGVIARLVDFVFFVVYALLGIRLVLTLLAAGQDAPFAQWIARVSEPLYAPFRGLLPNLTTDAGFTLPLPLIFGLLVYALLHAGIRRLLRVIP